MITVRARIAAVMTANPSKCTPKNAALHNTFTTAFIIKKRMICLKIHVRSTLFHTISAEIVARTKSTVHTAPMIAPDGVHDGSAIV